ncbi:winged helix-turn-helix transcriptional regulator [Microbulbifer sp. ZKSA002]|uniref:winged helix-turn-helix transcriptional regulator n=1 Tax=Microbulbifer sp. ZKSA002 TaxID=3243388 RepID=UPI004039F7D0
MVKLLFDNLWSEGVGTQNKNSERRVFVNDDECPVRNVVAQIGDKWSILILFALVDGPDRFNSLKSRIEGISQRMLTQTLRDLERDGFVLRTVFAQVPVKVEYELTDLGKGLSETIWELVSWADNHHSKIRSARQRYDEKSDK